MQNKEWQNGLHCIDSVNKSVLAFSNEKSSIYNIGRLFFEKSDWFTATCYGNYFLGTGNNYNEV